MQIQTSEVEQLRQEIAELRRNKVPKNDEQIHSAKINTPSIPTTPIKSSIQSLESGNQSLVYRNPVTDIVNLAIQIQDSENQQLRQENDKLRRNKVTKNDEPIHSEFTEHPVFDPSLHTKIAKKNLFYDEDGDINDMICLFKVLMAAIVLLLMFVGVLVQWENHKNNRVPSPCINVVIGDGVCDDAQNIAECRYDGNDCCLRVVNISFCEDCECHLGKCSD
jgi:hypothetical protein